MHSTSARPRIIIFAEDVQRRWQNDSAVPARYLFGKLRAPLAVRYIKPGAIVVPGLSGQCVQYDGPKEFRK